MAFSPQQTPPRHAVLLKLDTLGDLVLFSPALTRLRQAWPATRITVLIRSVYGDLARLIDPEIEWLATPIDTFRQGPARVQEEARRLWAEVERRAPDVILAASSRRTWLETYLASAAPSAKTVSFGDDSEDPFYKEQLEGTFGAAFLGSFKESIPALSGLPDWKQNQHFVNTLLGQQNEALHPILAIEEVTRELGRGELERHRLAPGSYAVCAAAGHANVTIKAWSREGYAALARHLREEHGIRTLFVGQEDEREYLASILEAAKEAEPALWLGKAGDLPLLASLIAQARLYYGNDTGAMHLAAATGLPVLAIFGGGTWPRFRPAARRSIELVNPLPCFGCGWDCAFIDAPCVKSIQIDDAKAAISGLVATLGEEGTELRFPANRELQQGPLIEKAFARSAEKSRQLRLRQGELDRTVLLASEKDGEIRALKSAADEKDKAIVKLHQNEIPLLRAACAERLELIEKLDGHVRNLLEAQAKQEQELARLRKELSETRAKAEATETFYTRLSPDAGKWAQQVGDLEGRVTALESEKKTLLEKAQGLATALHEKEVSIANLVAGLGTLELHNFYRKQLRDKEDVLQELNRACKERERIIQQMAADATKSTAAVRRFRLAAAAWWRFRISDPLNRKIEKRVLDGHWMQLGSLHQYEARPLRWEKLPGTSSASARALPTIGVVTPSYNQAAYLERTLSSIAGQLYPKLLYVVQDGGSKDGSEAIIRRHADKLRAWECVKDKGQADAIVRGFSKIQDSLKPDDLMAWVNSDDLLAPGSLAYVGRYFAEHPEVDAIYGNRVVIDTQDREVARWIMPRHDPETLRWFDFVPQETLFWRKRIWDKAGGLDPNFHFALDWDLLLRFQEAGARIVRLPRLLGAFRVHGDSKTTVLLGSRGREEMEQVRRRVHGAHFDPSRLDLEMRRAQYRGALAARLLSLGLRF